jgi:hypothetical protein
MNKINHTERASLNQVKAEIPAELRNLPNWGVWRNIEGRKIPYQLNGKPAKSNDSSTWTSFDHIKDLPNKLFFFPPDRSLTGIDVDDCIDEEGNFSDVALDILSIFQGKAYAEISPSGKGIKLWVKGSKPDFPCKIGSVECYDSRRSFTVTERALEGFDEIKEAENELLLFCQTYLQRAETSPQNGSSKSSSCADLISRAEAYASRFQGVESGRNQALFSLSGNLFSIEGENGERLGQQEVLSIVLFANRKNSPPLPEKEVLTLVSSSARNGTSRQSKPANTLPDMPFLDHLEKQEGQQEGQQEEEEEKPEPSEPFPIEVIPEPFRSLCKQISDATVSDIALSAVPCLVLLSALIGNSKVLRVKSSWKVPSVIWASVVAESGSVKSSPAKMIFEQLTNWQLEQIRIWKEKREAYLKEFQEYEKQLNRWKKSKEDFDQPDPPGKPNCKRILFKDFTIEKLGEELEKNPKGLVVAVDELANWFNSFTRYGKTDESSKWLEMFDASPTTIDRKSNELPIVVDKSAVSVFGTIQPKILKNTLSDEYRSSGLASRLLFVSPKRKLRVWNTAEPNPETIKAVQDVFDELIKLEPEVNDWGKVIPDEIPLSHSAMDLFIKFFNRHNRESFKKSGDILSAFSKLEQYALRFALIFETVKACVDGREVTEINQDSIKEGIELTEFFKKEAVKIYGLCIGSEEDFKKNEALDYVMRVRETSSRDFYRNNQTCFENTSLAEKFLQSLVDKGLGSWEDREPKKAGGRPTRTFVWGL